MSDQGTRFTMFLKMSGSYYQAVSGLLKDDVSQPMVEQCQHEAPRMLPRWALKQLRSTGQPKGDKRPATKVAEAA